MRAFGQLVDVGEFFVVVQTGGVGFSLGFGWVMTITTGIIEADL